MVKRGTTARQAREAAVKRQREAQDVLVSEQPDQQELAGFWALKGGAMGRRKPRTRKQAILAAKAARQRSRENRGLQGVIEEALNDIQTAKRAGDLETAEMYTGHAGDVLGRSGDDELIGWGRKADAAYKLFGQADKLVGKAYDVLDRVEKGVRSAGRK